jgi:hypothetical protein
MEYKGIAEKVNYLMQKSISKDYNEIDIKLITSYLKEHSDKPILGKVFGYSVSDYAYATLKWIGSEQTNAIFDEHFSTLTQSRKHIIQQLIDSKYYLQYN